MGRGETSHRLEAIAHRPIASHLGLQAWTQQAAAGVLKACSARETRVLSRFRQTWPFWPLYMLRGATRTGILLLHAYAAACFVAGPSTLRLRPLQSITQRILRAAGLPPRSLTTSSSPRMVVSPYASKPYPVGKPGEVWGGKEREAWLARQVRQRSYADEVLSKIDALKASQKWDVEQYGSLSVDADRFPLFVFKSREWNAANPTCLVTGGVHGYETSGVQGALLFLSSAADAYLSRVNLVVAPCISPWGYEHIQRWNNNADDPNRNFHPDSPCDECSALMNMLRDMATAGTTFDLHIDLHETTDSDEEEFMPAKAARDGVAYQQGYIPDGFYLVGDSAAPQPAWHSAIIEAVRKVTHIAPPDANGTIIGEVPTQDGVIVYPCETLNLCAAVTGKVGTIARYRTTTEVYPDSPKANDDICNRAQVASVTAAIDYLLASA